MELGCRCRPHTLPCAVNCTCILVHRHIEHIEHLDKLPGTPAFQSQRQRSRILIATPQLHTSLCLLPIPSTFHSSIPSSVVLPLLVSPSIRSLLLSTLLSMPVQRSWSYSSLSPSVHLTASVHQSISSSVHPSIPFFVHLLFSRPSVHTSVRHCVRPSCFLYRCAEAVCKCTDQFHFDVVVGASADDTNEDCRALRRYESESKAVRLRIRPLAVRKCVRYQSTRMTEAICHALCNTNTHTRIQPSCV